MALIKYQEEGGLSSPAENHCCAQEARLKGAATLRPTDKLVQDSAEQGSSPSSGQFFAYLIFSAAYSSSLTHPILNISPTARAANLSTLLQLPPVPPFFPHHPNSRYEENRYIPFFPSFSFFLFSSTRFQEKIRHSRSHFFRRTEFHLAPAKLELRYKF